MPRSILAIMENLRITTVQTALHWEDAAANLAVFDQKLAGLTGKTDLVILPEMFTTGFSMNATQVVETMEGPTVNWMREKASVLGAVVTGSIIIEESGHFFNRLVWMRPDGKSECYDKRHLFTLAKEHETYTAGKKKLVAEWKGWRICPLICYDLRFPVWSRNVEGYHLLIYVANWPEKRSHHWRQLLMARAIENQCYLAGVNRIGTDEMGFDYIGDTSVIDFSGKIIYQVSGVEDVFTTTLSGQALFDFCKSLQFLPDQDKFEISH